jgi:putative membrane protein
MGVTTRDYGPATERTSTFFLIAHVVLIALSTIAVTTFLAGEPPAWLQTESSQVALRIGWKFSGPTYVVLGALAALTHAASRIGIRRALLLLVAGFGISLGAELLGTTTGIPFGPYSYTTLLGWRVGGRVPFPIPLSWFYMIYASLAILGRRLAPDGGSTGRLRWAALAGLVLTAWDVAMDPAMSFATAHWTWHTAGFFYGMPLVNWFGWWLTGSTVAWVMLCVLPQPEVAARVSPSPQPLVLYAVNGLFPIAICVRYGLWWAAALGSLAMATPLWIALRSPSRANRFARAAGDSSRSLAGAD